MLRLKPEVRFTNPVQALPVIVSAVESVFATFGYDTVVTSLGEGRHKPDSYHYKGLAADFRIKHVPEGLRRDIVNALKASLPQCDVLYEGAGTQNVHIHVEWDPK